jgi:hypothetical protein
MVPDPHNYRLQAQNLETTWFPAYNDSQTTFYIHKNLYKCRYSCL